MITDDELLLYYYRDGLEPAERARIGAALGEQPELARRLQSLVAHLDKVATATEVPVPAEFQRRWQAALDREADNVAAREISRSPTRSPFSGFRWPIAAAVATVAIVAIVRFTTPAAVDRGLVVSTPDIAPVARDEASAYERGLKVHLASTEQSLAAIGTAKPEERARLIATITAQNRMYALAAERAGEPQLARVLRAFEPILGSLAQDGGGDSTAAIAQLNFELRVMQGRLGADARSNAQTTTL